MPVHLRQQDWFKELRHGLKVDSSVVRIVSPFIKEGAVLRLFDGTDPASVRVITRFNLDHFSEGVSDISALRALIDLGAQIRGVKRLHTKLYVFGGDRAVITSANLTEAGLDKNHELGVVARGGSLGSDCRKYFDEMWDAAGVNLDPLELEDWQERIAEVQAAATPAPSSGLGDQGTDVCDLSDPPMPAWVDEPGQGFVKFFGKGDNRALRNYSVLEELERGGSHWACTYPRGKRPRAPRDGAVMFMGRLVHSPNDTLIYGRAIAIRYEEGRDDASAKDLEMRPWKKWPHYIRVHHGEFLAGAMENGVSLAELMDELGPHAFGSTAENLELGSGNTNPRRAIRQAPAVRLSPDGLAWLNEELEAAFEKSGKLQAAQLAQLDWPDIEMGGH